MPGLLPRRPPAARPPRVRAADAVPARVPRATSTARCASAAAGSSSGTAAPSASCRAGRARPAPTAVHCSADVGPFARRRASACARRCGAARRRARCAPGPDAVDDVGALAHPGGQALHRLLAVHRTWLAQPRARRCSARRARSAAAVAARQGPAPVARARSASRRTSPSRRPAARPRRASALDRVPRRAGRATTPRPRRPRRDRTSRLSPYLHFGCISAARARGAAAAAARARRRSGASSAGATSTTTCCSTFRATPRSEFQERYRGAITLEPRRGGASRPGARAAPASRSWTPACASCGARAGCTTASGWSSGSFLTKDLGIDWRWGERWFMRLLVDGDQANNNGNWQWIASVGTDPAAGVPADLQPRAPHGALRPGRRLRAPATSPSCATCPTSTWPSRGRCPTRSSTRPAA